MGKLRYYYGCMNSMKSSTLLMKSYQFEQSGCRVLLFKPSFDTRDFGEIRSRAVSYRRSCFTFSKDVNVKHLLESIPMHNSNRKTILFFDEINFMTREQIHQLWEISREYDMDVYCYGLKLSYNNKLFDAAESLIILADTVEEIKSMCSRCDNKATTHLRIVNDLPIFDGEVNLVGDVVGEEKYISVCQTCWHKEYIKHNQEGINER